MTLFVYTGAYNGNCGWSQLPDVYGEQENRVLKNFKPCEVEIDKFCGLLHCRNDVQAEKDILTKVSLNTLFAQIRWDLNNNMCLVAAYDVGKLDIVSKI